MPLTQEKINKSKPSNTIQRLWDETNTPQLYYIIKPSGRRTWMIAYTLSNGERCQSKIADGSVALIEARKIASIWLAEIGKGNDPRKILKQKKEPTPKCKTLREIITLYSDWMKDHKKGTYTQTVNHLMTFKSWLDRPVTVITKAGVDHQQQDWRKNPSEKTGKPLAATTVNRRTAALWPMLDWAAERGYCPKPDCRVKKLRKGPQAEPRHLSYAERFRLHVALASIRNSTPYLPYFVKFMLNTGVRPGSLRHIQWKDFDFSARTLHLSVDVMKSDNDWTIPLNGPAYRTILQWGKKSGKTKGLVFPGGAADGTIDPATLIDNFKTLTTTAKIENFTCYDLRHTFATDLVAQNVNLAIIQKLMCHTNIEMTLKYIAVTPPQLAVAAESLSNIMKK